MWRLWLLISPVLVTAFTVQQHSPRNQASALFTAPDPNRGEVQLITHGHNIDITPALNDYVEKRIGGALRKLGGDGIVREVDVHLSVYKNPRVRNAHRVDLNANLKGLTIHCKKETPDMYTSIDAVCSALKSKLSKYRQRRKEGFHSGNRLGDDLMAALSEADLEEEDELEDDMIVNRFVDPWAPNVTKDESYDLDHPIPLEEAIFALDYVDHNFFVFKNVETGRPSVVYKRNAGHVGLIEL